MKAIMQSGGKRMQRGMLPLYLPLVIFCTQDSLYSVKSKGKQIREEFII
jgi:hypothetical protein